jgi:hypothetical protein
MTLKTTFVGCCTVLLGLVNVGCATTSDAQQKEDTAKLLKQMPDYTTTDPKTGCRYIKDDQNPDKPQPCLPNDFPQRHIK